MKEEKILYQKFFLKFFEKFFCLKSLFGLIYSEKIFFEKFQKNFWPEKNLNFFFQMKNFTILSNFFAKVRQEYQNIFPQLYKNHHCRSVSLIVLSQKPSQNKHFNVGHPVWEFHGFLCIFLNFLKKNPEVFTLLYKNMYS